MDPMTTEGGPRMRTKETEEKKKPQRRRKRPESLPLCCLKEIREAQRKSIVQLSEDSSVHRNLIARIEDGLQEGSASNHLKLIKALGISADEYFGFISSKPVSKDKPEILDSRKGFTVELFPTLEGTAKRIQITPGEGLPLKPYLDPQKPVFFYVVQGEIKFQRKNETYEQGPGAALSFPRASNLSLKNISSLGGILLAFQC